MQHTHGARSWIFALVWFAILVSTSSPAAAQGPASEAMPWETRHEVVPVAVPAPNAPSDTDEDEEPSVSPTTPSHASQPPASASPGAADSQRPRPAAQSVGHERRAERGRGMHWPEGLVVTPGGYLEFFYSQNFNRPQNNVTALRGFDFINGSMMIGNFVMSVDAAYKTFSTRLAINIGANPSQFYAQEPTTEQSHHLPALDRNTWSLIQEAVVGWSPRRARGLTLQAGVMATPIGIEGLANYQSWRGSLASPHMLPKDYRDNWNWSRSNSLINVPDYHSGVRVLYSRDDKHHFGAFLVNGANAITDNNSGKTVAATYLWSPSPRFQMSAVYMGGPERSTGAPEGQGWRHLLDFWIRWEATKNLHFMTQAVPGIEDSSFGLNVFLINVAYASWRFRNDARIAFRYEHLFERVADGSSSVFVRSLDANNRAALYGYTGTFSLPIVPDHLMIRLEYRHDRSPLTWFYKGELRPSGDDHAPWLPNARSQNTATVGLVGWF